VGVTAPIVLIVVITIAVLVFQRREPAYAGKPLSHWLAQLWGEPLPLHPPQDPPAPEAEVAVRSIGTNALPFLLRSLTVRDSHIKEALLKLEESQPKISLGLKSRDGRVVEEAVVGYVTLAEIAEPAVPDLVALVNGQDEIASYAAGAVLPYLGAAGIEATVKLLSSTNRALRRRAAFGFASPVLRGTNQNRYQTFNTRYRQQGEHAVPALLGLLNDNDTDLAQSAIHTLSWLSWHPDEVIPALTSLAGKDSTPIQLRVSALRAIGMFGKTAASAVPFLQTFTNDANKSIRAASSNAIWRIGGATSNMIDAVK